MYSNWDCCYSKLVNTVMQQPDEAMVQYPYEVTDTYSLIITFQQNLPTTPRRERENYTLQLIKLALLDCLIAAKKDEQQTVQQTVLENYTRGLVKRFGEEV